MAAVTKSQKSALLWLKNRNGDGVFDRNGVLNASGERAPYMRGTWNKLRDAGLAEFYLDNRRLRLTEAGKAADLRGVSENSPCDEEDNTNTNPRGGETPAMIPVETATETQKRLLVSTDPLNSQALSVPADAAGGGSSSPVTGTHSHSTGATVEAETTTSQAVSANYSTWSPWSVCKGSI